jgi:DNA-binding transcriptional ArsR family regulator
VQAVLDALQEPRRREILRLVRDDEMLAGTIAARFPDVARPTVSQHLRVLLDAGLVVVRQEGTRRLYRARREALGEVRAFVEEFWQDSLQVLKVEAEAEQRRRTRGNRR